mgnify:CR=1 FL=1
MSKLKLLFCVHRYAPFPGGSEIYVQNMAEESLRRGHTVVVFAGEHQGDYNGVTVTNDANILLQQWDLIIVHGGDVNVQNFVLSNASRIPSPILYLLILPSTSNVCLQALRDCAYIGSSTNQDWDHCKKYGVENKAVKVRHGIALDQSIGLSGFKEKYNIQGTMFLSCGGYWPNKAMKELVHVFKSVNPKNATLVTTGYDNRMNLMPGDSDNVKNIILNDRADVLSAIKDADCYIMHSYQEGFGLVLLEAMVNKTPWISRKIAGAELMRDYGHTYTDDIQLVHELLAFSRDCFSIERGYEYAMNNHLIQHTVDDIETVA